MNKLSELMPASLSLSAFIASCSVEKTLAIVNQRATVFLIQRNTEQITEFLLP